MDRWRMALICAACTQITGWAGDCAALSSLKLTGVTIQTAAQVEGGSFQPPAGRPQTGLPAFCRVAGSIHPSADSDIRFEVWMPVQGWNGKFYGVGNGGFAGSIGYGELSAAVKKGYAAASTDTGHQGGGTNAGWALGHPEKIVDFGRRAIHEMTVQAKAIQRAFYGAGPKRSYFSSCSNGGRQALMEAQRYPDDYDGIIAGAPANYWTHLLANAMRMAQSTAGDSYIPASKLPAIQAAARQRCDAQDGVQDGVLENPTACRLNIQALQCAGAVNDDCLTPQQGKALESIYGGMRDERGRVLFPGYAPGGEAEDGGWSPWIVGMKPESSLIFAFGHGFFRNMIHNDPNWDYRRFDLARDTALAVERAGPVMNATNPDLSAFQARGGRLILYHGWCDAAIPAQNTIDYYESVRRRMGARRAGAFVRLFMAPGVQHCAGGSGPSVFGQGGVPQREASHDMAAALERWVEEGKAPERIIATRFNKGMDPASGVARTRPLCAYPKVARYKGTGSTDDAANFECSAK